MMNDFENFLDILPGRIICLDKNNTIKSSNIGAEYNDLLIFDVLEEYEIDSLKEQLEYSKNSKSSCEYITTKEEPFKKWYKNIIKPKFDNLSRFEGYTLYKEDITEIKRLEEKLFRTQYIYYEAFEAIGIGVWELELTNNFFIISDVLKRLLNSSTVLVTKAKWRSRIHPDDIEMVDNIFEDFIKSGEDRLLEHIYRIKSKDKYIWFKSTGKAIKHDSDGNIIKILGVAQDITEQILTKESLKKYNEKLEEKVNERTLELKIAKKEADIANMAKSEFLSNISHEFFTPLNIILNSAKIMSKKMKNDDNFQKTLNNIEKSGNSLNELVQNMLYLVRLDLNTIKFKMYKTDIINLLNSVILEIRKKYKIHIKTNILSNERYVYCDSMNIKMVILELIENSIKHINKQEKSILIEIINNNNNNNCILFKIKDTGIGVKQDELNSIFDRFFLGSNTKNGSGGKGLGLPLCREIIKKHNGKIWAENNIDEEGLTVFFTLPIMGENND